MINANAQKYLPRVKQIAAEEGVDPALVAGLIETESGWNPTIKNSIGATGLGQFMEAAAKDYGVSDRTDPDQSIRGVARYLKSNLQKFGKPELAVAGYNAGPGAVQKYNGIPPFKETQLYVPKVMDAAKRYSGFDWGDGNQQQNRFQLNDGDSQNKPQNPQQDQSQGQAQPSVLNEMMKAAGLDEETQKRQRRAEIFDTALSGLAAAFAGLHQDGGKSQEAILQRMDARQQQRAEQRQGALAKLMDAYKATNKQQEPTSLQRDYEAAVKQGYKGNLIDYQKEVRGDNPLKDSLALLASNLGVQKSQLEIDKTKAEIEKNKNPPLSSEAAKTIGNISDGLSGLDSLESKIKAGNNLLGQALPYGIGDRDTRALIDNITDVIGRLRSGGAINKDEESRFKGLIPSYLDDPETKANKIASLRNYFNSVGVGLAGSPEEFQSRLDKMRSLASGANQKSQPEKKSSVIKQIISSVSGMQSSAQPSPYSGLSDDEIKKKLGVQ